MLNHIFNRQNRIVLLVAIFIALYLVIISSWCFLKFNNNSYNGLDLGIYTNVFTNTINGHWFASSIHPPSYLGDHLELFILPLAALYKLAPSPLTLLFLQTLFLALAAWPLYLIAKNQLSSAWGLAFVGSWLLCPFVLNINLFEFHLLAFAPFFLFWLIYSWQRQNFALFLLSCLLVLSLREDLALVVAATSLLLFTEPTRIKKSDSKDYCQISRWLLMPLLLGIGWFILASLIIKSFNPAGTYKFLVYYDWLGNSWPEIILSFFTKPLLVLGHLFSLDSLVFILGIFIPFCYLPLLGWLWLLPALPLAAEFLLGSSGSAVLLLHYSAGLLPWLFVAEIEAIKKLKIFAYQNKLIQLLQEQKKLLYFFLAFACLYGLIAFAPRPSLVLGPESVKLPTQERVMASDSFLTSLANRPNVSLLRYWFRGKLQFTDLPYAFPTNTKNVIFSEQDLLYYQTTESSWLKQTEQASGGQRLRQLLENYSLGCEQVRPQMVWLTTNHSRQGLYDLNPARPKQLINRELASNVFLVGLEQKWSATNLDLSLVWKKIGPTEAPAVIKISFLNQQKQATAVNYLLLAHGFFTFSELPSGQTISTPYSLVFKQKPAYLRIQLVKLVTTLTLAPDRNVKLKITASRNLGPTVILPLDR